MPASVAGEEKFPYPASGLEQAIGYSFRDKELLQNALRHSSYSNETKKELINRISPFISSLSTSTELIVRPL